MLCENVVKLYELKEISCIKINNINTIIRSGRRDIIDLETINRLQDRRSELEKQVNICNSLLNNVRITEMNIDAFIKSSNIYIMMTDDLVQSIARFTN